MCVGVRYVHTLSRNEDMCCIDVAVDAAAMLVPQCLDNEYMLAYMYVLWLPDPHTHIRTLARCSIQVY
jgi:hypothetical protein